VAFGLLLWALFDVPWWWRPAGHSRPMPTVLGFLVLAVVQSVPMVWRRSRPLLALTAAAACLAIKYCAGMNVWSAGGAALTAAYSLGAYGGRACRAAARWSAAAALVAVVVLLQAARGDHRPAIACALLAASLGMGEAAASHRDVAAANARQVQSLERAEIAREIHDLLAHQLSAIAVQSGAARLASDRDPEAARRAVTVIEQQARQGMAELNQLVRALRSSGPEDRLPDSWHRLGDIPHLVEQARRSGLRVEFSTSGEPRSLPETVELAGYRTVQEGLTNAIRYAAGSKTSVLVRYTEEGVVVQVTDDGPATPTLLIRHEGGGLGLAGLTERVGLLGGRLEASPRPEGGFVLRACLPGAR
jgi:signal transduction histidine kinase